MMRTTRWILAACASAAWLVVRSASAQANAQQQEPGGGMQGGMMQGGGMQGGMMQGSQGMPGTQGQPQQAMPTRPHVAGNVASVDVNRSEIVLEGGRKLTLGTQAQILEGGQQISLQTLQPGDRVRASFDPQGRVEQVFVMHRAGQTGTSAMPRQRTPAPGAGQGQQVPPPTPQPGTSNLPNR